MEDGTISTKQTLTTMVSNSRRSLHNQKKTCASCGYPAAKIRKCMFETPAGFGIPREDGPEDDPLTGAHRQLVREGEAQKGYRYRPHEVPQHSVEEVQERLPDRHPQGRSGPRGFCFFIIGCHDGLGLGRGRWDGSFSASGVTGAGHFSDGPTRFSLLHKWHDFARHSVQGSKHRAKVMKNGVTFGTNHTDSFLGKFRVKGSNGSKQREEVVDGAKQARPTRAGSGLPESPASWLAWVANIGTPD